MKRLLLIIGFGAGYVAGSAAGRERYEQIRSLTLRVKNDPQVQAAAARATETVTETVKDKAPVVKDKVAEAASVAAQKVRSGDSEPSLDDSQSGYPVSGR